VSLKVVKETELAGSPEQQPKPSGIKPSESQAEQTSGRSSDLSRASLALLDEIRLVLNARASVVLALMAAAALTYLAMDKGTGMALSIAATFDLFIFLPLAYIAYLRRRE
jgi:hypothetical protein